MDICMAQKSHFKAVKTGTYIKRYTFPQLPWAELDHPKTLKTKRGELLLDGFWAYLRKPSEWRAGLFPLLDALETDMYALLILDYISDWIQAIIWGASAGQGSVIPYYYPVFHATMLLHRNSRDEAKCARKYGDDWVRYKKLVPYS